LLLAALSMATSPVTVLRVLTERHSSGQASERLLYLATLNTVLAVFVFKIILGWAVLRTSGNILAAAYSSLVVVLLSVLLGLFAGVLTPVLLRFSRRNGQDSTLAFALAVICLVALTFGLKLLPVLATLSFGLYARHGRLVLNASQRGFGSLGDLFSVLLFVFIASRLQWPQVLTGLGMGLAFVAVRLVAKTVGIGLFAHASGIAWRKGLWIGLASVPTPALVILVLEQTRYLGSKLEDQLAPLAAATLVLEIGGPLLVQRALIWAREVPDAREP
jgi:Kef-type K+ transport system membrane component KefB